MRRLLEDVAARARLEPALEERALAVGGEDEHRRAGNALEEHLRRLEAVHVRHAEIHDHDVGPAPLGQRHRGRAVARLADHADARRARQRQAEPFAHDLVVVGDEHGDLVRHGAILRGASRRLLLDAASAARTPVAAGCCLLDALPVAHRRCPSRIAHQLLDRARDRVRHVRAAARRAARSARPPPASPRRAPRGSARACRGGGRRRSPRCSAHRRRGPRGRPPPAALGRSEMPGQDRRHADADLDPGLRRAAAPPRAGCAEARCPAPSSARRARRASGSRSRRRLRRGSTRAGARRCPARSAARA